MKTDRDGSKKHLSGSSGFTLLELMIALVILAFGLMGVALMVATSVRGNAFAARMTQATALAQGKIEEMRNIPYISLYANCGAANCWGPPDNMALNADGTLMATARDDGTEGDELTGIAGDGIWTYKYVNAAEPLPAGTTLVWAMRRNYPQAGLVWLMAVVQWEEGKTATTTLKQYTTCMGDPANPLEFGDTTYRVCVESVLGNF